MDKFSDLPDRLMRLFRVSLHERSARGFEIVEPYAAAMGNTAYFED